MKHRSSLLQNPQKAALAWARYRRVMAWMMAVTVLLVIGMIVHLWRGNGLISVHFYIAAALGLGLSMLLASALMGLAFLSSSSGHDDAVGSAQTGEDAITPPEA
ncbi:hypothetical protein [Novosphingobium sp. 9]|uniref:hypothetical protein n=1 Tax=Novosphingobium sp. 9 TaxID=2025349 RepID=UPI0021B6A48C|nr:hypothetical protein [Novosphingobium sp. 9]